MEVIYKYRLKDVSEFTLDLPVGFKVLKVGLQNDAPYLWAAVDPNAPTETVVFLTQWTGVELDDRCRASQYIGTVINDKSGIVLHYYMISPMR